MKFNAMENINRDPVTDTSGGSEKKSLQESEKSKIDLFKKTVNDLLDTWVKEGRCPVKWADMKRESVAMITDVNSDPETISQREKGELPSSYFADKDVEAYSVEFAGIGLGSVVEFTKKADDAKRQVLEQVQPLLDRVTEVINLLKKKVDVVFFDKNAIRSKVNRLQEFQDNLNNSVTKFEADIEKIKELNFEIEKQVTAEDIQASLKELEDLLNKES